MEAVNELVNRYKYPILICVVGLVLLFFGYSSDNHSTTPPAKTDIPKESIIKAESLEIKADIGGAVIKPGVYSLAKDSRVEDLIREAGGLESSASAEYVTKQLNLSQKVTDGQKVYIPFKGEEKSTSVLAITSQTSSASQNGAPIKKVNINNGTQQDIESLPGIGPVTATKIISNRPYADVNELVSKKSIGKAIFEKIKDKIEL